MERGNSKHGPRLDDQMQREVEASGDDQPDVAEFPEPGQDHPGGAPEGITSAQAEERARFAAYLSRSVFPANARTLRAAARAANAPDNVLALLDRLPDVQYVNVAEVWQAVGGGIELRRW